jgi:hypothetical protein
VAKQGVSMGDFVNAETADEAKSQAIAKCKLSGSAMTKALCKVVATFKNQGVALAIDPKAGTPGFGWATGDMAQAAREQAMANCRHTAGPARQDACQIGGNAGVLCDGSAK